MKLIDNIWENERDKKVLQLYTVLSHSDFKGNYEDTYIIELVFALMCLDLIANSKDGLELNPKEFILLSKELVRIIDIDGELDIYSFANWAQAMIKYMKENNVKPNQIHKMNTYDLRKSVEVNLERDS